MFKSIFNPFLSVILVEFSQKSHLNRGIICFRLFLVFVMLPCSFLLLGLFKNLGGGVPEPVPELIAVVSELIAVVSELLGVSPNLSPNFHASIMNGDYH